MKNIMIIIDINDINLGYGNKAFHFFLVHLNQNLFSKIEITPIQYFHGDPIPISFLLKE